MAESVEGLRELSKKLDRLSDSTSGKTLRSAAFNATLPVVQAAKAAAPVGSVMHKTYKGTPVLPGFLAQSIRRRSKYKNGVATVDIGVAPEAYYGLQFVERGTVKMPPRKWFERQFNNRRALMVRRLADQLRKKIRRLVL